MPKTKHTVKYFEKRNMNYSCKDLTEKEKERLWLKENYLEDYAEDILINELHIHEYTSFISSIIADKLINKETPHLILDEETRKIIESQVDTTKTVSTYELLKSYCNGEEIKRIEKRFDIDFK